MQYLKHSEICDLVYDYFAAPKNSSYRKIVLNEAEVLFSRLGYEKNRTQIRQIFYDSFKHLSKRKIEERKNEQIQYKNEMDRVYELSKQFETLNIQDEKFAGQEAYILADGKLHESDESRPRIKVKVDEKGKPHRYESEHTI